MKQLENLSLYWLEEATRAEPLDELCAALPNIEINEFAFGEAPWRADLIDPPEAFDRGHLVVGDRPGFGIALNEAVVRRQAK